MNICIRSGVLFGSAISVLVISSGTFAQTAGLGVTGIRAYADGNMHLFFSGDVSGACGKVIRVAGPGKEDVRALATAAMMSGRTVAVEAESQRSGNFCNLISIRLEN